MLETVKQHILDLPDIPFNKFFLIYIFSVQDNFVEQDVRTCTTEYHPDVNGVCKFNKYIDNLHGGLMSNDKF